MKVKKLRQLLAKCPDDYDVLYPLTNGNWHTIWHVQKIKFGEILLNIPGVVHLYGEYDTPPQRQEIQNR